MKHILVVDDELKLCDTLATLFNKKGFRVATANSVHEALEKLPQIQADVVVLDLRLPDGSGMEVLSELKARHPETRVVVISALAEPATIKEAFDRGASSYLTKPFDFSACFYAAMGIEAVHLASVQPAPEALARVPVAIARQYAVLPLRLRDGVLELAMGDPLDVQELDELRAVLGLDVKPLAILSGELPAAIATWYGVGAGVASPSTQRAPATAKPRVSAKPSAETRQAASIHEDAGVVQLFDALVRQAHANRATDVHFGIGAQGPWIRQRIDGMLYDVTVSANFQALYNSVVSRIKVMADLDIAEHRLPQDGRIWFEADGLTLDLRVSVLPTLHGESVAIRLLEPSRILHVEHLGMGEEQLHGVKASLQKPTGLLLITGPTGSGKSTSLYALLSQLNTGRANIITVEDPVEHELKGVTQIQVHPKVSLTFAAGLRSMLRHDPDVMMVGEIRDQETASLAVRAAITGHLVLSTLHTNDAASGVTRLVDLGVEPFLLCSTMSGILSQRLVRRLCTQCRVATEVAAASLLPMGVTVPEKKDTVRLWTPKGCAACRQTGYHGRTGVFEWLPVDHHIRSLILKHTPSAQLRQSAASRGMATLWHSGWELVQSGATSLDELLRVLPQEPTAA
ncbi:MAG: type II secretion system protein GspE [Candidatus Omnitrophica bacterium CG11_big_fil_rev_8_21_14_0_20_63_9]|nr:MAG: type II secretion system protein GspE [Candidatus Omnitrophica bacterium CG11_big_fil_rev_8_21_14_0_20_63_9]